ncbi:MAG TPA: XrtA-associated tyrosine autokinase [Stellaceae bacterium]|nr:XrtA-associated tyrosine autokinase [Stellaceae bacterium]
MDLIQRAAERLKRSSELNLVEQAAAKLASASPQPATSEPPTPPDAPSVAPVIAETPAPPPPVIPPTTSAVSPLTAPAGEGSPRRPGPYVTLDLGKLQVSGFVTPTGSRTRIAEEFRVIKRPILLRAFATGEERIESGNLMMVTSAKPGEGKTFTAINLAMSMASERDIHVLLVDADVQRPSVFQVLGLPPQKGLLDVLSDSNLNPADVLTRTNIRNLTLMAAGTPSLATTELLASQKMIDLMQDIATRYQDRIIILDAPPVLASSEPSVLALHVGQVILVVEAGKTGRRAVEQTLTYIGGCPNISIVLNKADSGSGRDEFGGYGYGYYETNE